MTDDYTEAELANLLSGLSDDELRVKLDILRKLQEHKKYNRLEYFKPYPKQAIHFALGKTKRERLLTSGNQYGKTECGAAEAAYHLTGLYPKDWQGRIWTRPTRGWACGETSLATRDTIQRKLMGEPGVTAEFGAGLIPKHLILDTSLARGVTDAFDTVQVKHVSGGISIVKFKSYEQGRSKFQGETIDWVWDDEEPPIEVYTEQLARITATAGMIVVTFTSLLGDTQVTDRFTKEDHPERAMTVMGLRDALHISPEQYDTIIGQYPVHERVARIEGGIMRGEGRVFSIGQEVISEPPIASVPEHWAKLFGIDFGIGHPFAWALILWDRDADVIHLHKCGKMRDALPLQQATPMKAIGANVMVAWPKDGTARDKGSGEPLASIYKKTTELRMLPTHATFEDGSVSTEAGVMEMWERMTTGRFKVSSELSEFWEEFRAYHRKGGQIVKVNDDILSAVRTAIMAKRFAKPGLLGNKRNLSAPNNGLAIGLDFDVFA